MNVEYINAFVESSVNVINQTTGLTVKTGKTYVKNRPYKGDNIIVMIGLTGKIVGNVVITFKTDLACKIASYMMMGMPVTELNDIAKSAICELCNMILGNTVTILANKGMNIDITPPSILTGQNLELSVHKSIVVCVPLIFDDGSSIDIDISYVDR